MTQREKRKFDGKWAITITALGCALSCSSTESAAPTPNNASGAGGSLPAAGAAPGVGGSAVTAGTGGTMAPPNQAGTGGSDPLPVAGSGGSGGSTPGVPGVWTLRKTITLDTTPNGADVPEAVQNYPLAVMLDATNFDFSQTQATGADIRFFDAQGTALPHSIEFWDAAEQKAAIWVLLPEVQGNSADQSIIMKWGNTTAPDTSDSKAVFKQEDGFVGVWHLDEDGNTNPDGYKDSSSHEAHGTGVGMIPGSRVDARIGKGSHLDNPNGQDTARWIVIDSEKAEQFNPGPPITVSIWMLGYSYPIRSYETMIAKGDTSWSLQRVQYDRNGYQACLWASSYHQCIYDFDGQALVTEEWLHFMLTLDEPNMRLYINGELNSQSGGGGAWEQGDHPLGIGNQTQALGGRRQWDGILDEARVMQALRSPSWAKLEYESQRESPTLVGFGQPEPEPEP